MDKQELADTRLFLIRTLRSIGLDAILLDMGGITAEQYVDMALYFANALWVIGMIACRPYFSLWLSAFIMALIWAFL